MIAGHSGIAFTRQIGDVAWINAGVISMPPNNGRADTQYVLIRKGEPEICALSNDVSAAQAAMKAAGLVQGYHTALGTGLWPSEDVLPANLRLSA